MHIYMPLIHTYNYDDQTRAFAESVGKILVDKYPYVISLALRSQTKAYQGSHACIPIPSSPF